MKEIRYMISDAAKKINVEPHVLRYWEEELGTEIPRNEMGHRYYREEDIQMMRGVKYLKEKGFQLKSIKILLPEVDKTMQLPQRRLLELRDRLELAVSREELRLQREAELKNYSGQGQEDADGASGSAQLTAGADEGAWKAAGRANGQKADRAGDAEEVSARETRAAAGNAEPPAGRGTQADAGNAGGQSPQEPRTAVENTVRPDGKEKVPVGGANGSAGQYKHMTVQETEPPAGRGTQTAAGEADAARQQAAAQEPGRSGGWNVAAQEAGKPDRPAAVWKAESAAQKKEKVGRAANAGTADRRLTQLGSGTQADKLVSNMLAENAKEARKPEDTAQVSGRQDRPANAVVSTKSELRESKAETTPVTVSDNAERMRQFRRIMNEIIMDVMRENNKELTETITSSVSREVEYHMRRREMLQEEHFKQLDRTLREYQLGQKQAAVAKECGGRRESKFFKKNGKVRI